MTPMEKKLRNTPLSRAVTACNERNGGTYGVAIRRGTATLNRIDVMGGNTVETPVAGPVPMGFMLAMVEGYNA